MLIDGITLRITGHERKDMTKPKNVDRAPVHAVVMPPCADCGGIVGQDSGPPDGWQLEDGRTVCQACCVADMKTMIRRQHPKSLHAAGCELQEAVRSLCLEVVYALKIDRLCDWMAKTIRRWSA